MPAYDYQCGFCGKAFSVNQSYQDVINGKKPKCPNCGSKRDIQRKILTLSHVAYKGEGFTLSKKQGDDKT